jgi:hypothetical protein
MRLCWTLVYIFGIRGATAPASDGRVAILLEPGERDLVLTELRAFLQASQAMVQAGAKGDLSSLAAAARRMGIAAQHEVPASVIGKLPLKFQQLGFDTHARLDRLALDAESLGNTQQALAALGDLMANCVACHAA